ncbi:MAG: Polyketide cyclase / dehydrase and lipid transport [Klenkia sp.]|nr:Polyketide cyclase / dehydrase and lipid transport [Klenkia sp.]
MTTATGTRTVPQSRAEVWRALAVLEPYCAVCDVSYVVTGKPGKGTTFVCVPGRLEADRPPGDGAPRGEIVEWEPQTTVATRLELTPETWTTRIQLADDDGGTAVTITVTHQPKGGSKLVRFVQKGATTRLVQHTVDAELAKLPEHLAQVNGPDGADTGS